MPLTFQKPDVIPFPADGTLFAFFGAGSPPAKNFRQIPDFKMCPEIISIKIKMENHPVVSGMSPEQSEMYPQLRTENYCRQSKKWKIVRLNPEFVRSKMSNLQ